MTKKNKKTPQSEDTTNFTMSDDRRMRESGAAESGYHAPTPHDIEDIRKDHHTASAAGAVNADEFIRSGGSTEGEQAEEDVANLHPRDAATLEESRDFGSTDDLENESEDDTFPAPVTNGGQMFDDHKAGNEQGSEKRRSA